MVCPVCKIDTKTDTVDGKLVLICKNPQCSNYKQVVKEVKYHGKVHHYGR